MTQKQINRIRAISAKSSDNIYMGDIIDLIEKYTQVSIKRTKKGDSVWFQCINGCDPNAHLDKCSFDITRNKAHCFGCDGSWGTSKLLAESLGIEISEANLLIALNKGDISQEEYDACTQSASNYNKLISDASVLTKIETKKAEETAEFRALPSTLDLVFRNLLSLDEFRITDDGIRYLMTKRGMTEKQIREGGFFNYHKTFSIDMLVEKIKLENEGFTHKDLWGVPGFYFEFSNKERTHGRWKFRRPNPSTLGIPLKNAQGQIIALQLRQMREDFKGNKYFYISSKKIKEEELTKNAEYSYGSSCGTPAHVQYPEVVTNSTFIIGEGVFKMYEAAKEGSVAISCQGVNSYLYAVEEISKILRSPILKERLSDKLKATKHCLNFVIAYDADMFDNANVLFASINLCHALKKEFPNSKCFFLVWDLKNGKGYDDLKEYAKVKGVNFKHLCWTVEASRFEELALEAITQTDQALGVTENSTSIRKTDDYCKMLQCNLFDNRIKGTSPHK